MNSVRYDFTGRLDLSRLSGLLERASEAVSRNDERLRRSPIRDGLIDRVSFHEALSTIILTGSLVHLEDLILYDAEANARRVSHELLRAHSVLRARRQLDKMGINSIRNPEGQAELQGRRGLHKEWRPTEKAFFYDPDHDEDALMEQFNAVAEKAKSFSPLIEAALIWDAWSVLEPVEFHGWRAALLASATLKANGTATHYLAAINWGSRTSRARVHGLMTIEERLAVFLQWVKESAERTYSECDRLTLARETMMTIAAKKRRNSRLPHLIDLLISRPVISIPFAARRLNMTHKGVSKLLSELGSTPRELTGNATYRAYGIV